MGDHSDETAARLIQRHYSHKAVVSCSAFLSVFSEAEGNALHMLEL